METFEWKNRSRYFMVHWSMRCIDLVRSGCDHSLLPVRKFQFQSWGANTTGPSIASFHSASTHFTNNRFPSITWCQNIDQINALLRAKLSSENVSRGAAWNILIRTICRHRHHSLPHHWRYSTPSRSPSLSMLSSPSSSLSARCSRGTNE